MNLFSRVCSHGVPFIAVLVAIGSASAQQLGAPAQGVLVLRGGEVVRGGISRVGETYVVSFADQGEMRVSASGVELHAGSLGEAYGRMLARTNAEDAGGQLALADWCVRQGLLREAADRLLAATLLDARHPDIRRIEARLWLAANPSPVSSAASADEQIVPPTASRAADSIPPTAVETFTANVQPLLLNRCAGCHRPGSGRAFQLMRTARGHALPRNFTQRNLAATLALVDRDATRESPLLTVPSAAHGGTGPIATALEAAQWENVARWIDELSQPPAGAPLDSVARREAVLWQPAAQPPVGTAANAAAKPGAAPRDDSHPLGDFTPRDPFDPEIFNRRHFKPEAVRPRGG